MPRKAKGLTPRVRPFGSGKDFAVVCALDSLIIQRRGRNEEGDGFDNERRGIEAVPLGAGAGQLADGVLGVENEFVDNGKLCLGGNGFVQEAELEAADGGLAVNGIALVLRREFTTFQQIVHDLTQIDIDAGTAPAFL